MSNLSQNQSSPFDSIRRVDEQRSEFWYARELQPALGYGKWERFSGSIDRAKVACNNSGNCAADHFFSEPGKSLGGRPAEDYKLSRYACYLVAMNSDPRKPEISAAQSYFAIKTRQAETMQPNGDAMLAQLVAQSQQMMLQTQQMMLQIAAMTQQQSAQIVTVSEKVAEIEAKQEEAVKELKSLPEPTAQANPLLTRAKIRRLVNDYVMATGVTHPTAWNFVYREFKDRYRLDLKQRAKNAQEAGKKLGALDICEQLDKVEELYAVAFELLKA